MSDKRKEPYTIDGKDVFQCEHDYQPFPDGAQMLGAIVYKCTKCISYMWKPIKPVESGIYNVSVVGGKNKGWVLTRK